MHTTSAIKCGREIHEMSQICEMRQQSSDTHEVQLYGSNNWSSINNTGLPRFRSISQYVTESIGIKNLEDNSHNILRKVLYTKCHHRESIRRPSALSLNSISSSTLEYISCKYLRDSSATMFYDAFVTDTKKQKND